MRLMGLGFRGLGVQDVPKIRGTFSEVPRIRIVVFWGLYSGPRFKETIM